MDKATFNRAVQILTHPKTGRIGFKELMELDWDEYRYLIEIVNDESKR
ncbi:hypothetical protein [Vibrio mediterranei]|nr:hypothetical protein [Vibrio mediterranei]MCY9855801.1 hypothetical protein [Vibrio mediterranei]